MRRRFGQSLRIGVAPHAVSLLRAGRWPRAALAVAAEAPIDAGVPFEAGLGAALARLLAANAYAGWPVTFIVDDALARLWQVTPPQGVAALTDLQGATALRFQALYGDSPAGWDVQADWDNASPFFAAALPRSLLAALTSAAAAHKLPLVAIAPHFVDAWNRWQGDVKAGAWFGLAHAHGLTLAAIEGGRLRAVRKLALAGDHVNAEALARLVAREALLLDVAPPALLQLCGDLPAALHATAAGALRVMLLDMGRTAGLSPAAALAANGSAAANVAGGMATAGVLAAGGAA
jgi:hypothetical protein